MSQSSDPSLGRGSLSPDPTVSATHTGAEANTLPASVGRMFSDMTPERGGVTLGDLLSTNHPINRPTSSLAGAFQWHSARAPPVVGTSAATSAEPIAMAVDPATMATMAKLLQQPGVMAQMGLTTQGSGSPSFSSGYQWIGGGLQSPNMSDVHGDHRSNSFTSHPRDPDSRQRPAMLTPSRPSMGGGPSMSDVPAFEPAMLNGGLWGRDTLEVHSNTPTSPTPERTPLEENEVTPPPATLPDSVTEAIKACVIETLKTRIVDDIVEEIVAHVKADIKDLVLNALQDLKAPKTVVRRIAPEVKNAAQHNVRFLMGIREKAGHAPGVRKKAYVLPDPLEEGTNPRTAPDGTRLFNPIWSMDVDRGVNGELISAAVALTKQNAGLTANAL
ncbi:hypothetical protein C8Q77DRAFT_1073070 [Trametes polyzona]|nr:hypothetical protein C8Q77DRAFT_1073070 [Trametes polyzona]